MMYLPFIFSIKTFEATFALILSTLAQIFTQTFILPLSVYCVYVWDIYIYIYMRVGNKYGLESDYDKVKNK